MLTRESPVARFVVIVLLILAALLSAALGAINHLSERARLADELHASAQVQADQLAASLVLPVWNFDRPQLEKIADSVLRDREAAGMILRYNDASSPTGITTFGRLRDDQGNIHSIDADIPLPAGNILEERTVTASGEPVGWVRVLYTTKYMQEELRNHLLSQILTFIALGIILAAGLYFLLWRIILRPLVLIEHYAAEVSTGAPARLAPARFRGELHRLRASIERMVQLLAARYDSLQQNQTMLSLVLNSTPQSIFWKDSDCRYLGCNRPFAHLAGLASPELIVGKTDFDLPWPREASELYRENDRQVMSTGNPKDHIVEPLHTSTGDNLTVETTKVPLRDAAGKVYGILGVFEDITARLENQRRIASQLRFEELVARISAQLVAATPDNLTHLLARALGDISGLLQVDRIVLGRTEEFTGEMVARAHFRLTDPPFPERLVISERYPALWRTLRFGRASCIPDIAALDDDFALDRAHFAEIGIQSQVTAPVTVEGRLRYLLAVATVGHTRAWTDEEVSRIQLLADLLASAAMRCEIEDAVRSSERQFRTFIEQAPVPIILVPSPDGAPIYFNPAFTRIFGFTRQDIRIPEDWWPMIYPQPAYRAQRHAAWVRIVEEVTKSGTFLDAEEAEMHTKSGETRYAQVRLSLVEGYRMSFINDLTDRRQAETTLRLTQYAVDNNPVMIFRFDMDGQVVYANDAACKQFGHSPAEILRLHIWDISPITPRDVFPQRRAQLIEQRSSLFESVYITRDGSSFPAEVRIQYVEFSGQRFFVVFAFDITQRRAAQEAEHAYTRRIQMLATELTRAEERQRRELATILHDGVGQNLFAATTQLLTARTRGDLACPEIERALALLDQITRDTRELTFELCPPVLYQLGLIPALERLADLFSARYHIRCTVTGATTGPADLNARGLAYQAIRELLNNIAKHAAATNVAISAAEEGDFVHIQIADDGKGFDPALLRPSAGIASSGFGLFHLRERIELLGGNLQIESSPGRGSRVQFTLPLSALQLVE